MNITNGCLFPCYVTLLGIEAWFICDFLTHSLLSSSEAFYFYLIFIPGVL